MRCPVPATALSSTRSSCSPAPPAGARWRPAGPPAPLPPAPRPPRASAPGWRAAGPPACAPAPRTAARRPSSSSLAARSASSSSGRPCAGSRELPGAGPRHGGPRASSPGGVESSPHGIHRFWAVGGCSAVQCSAVPHALYSVHSVHYTVCSAACTVQCTQCALHTDTVFSC